MNITSTLILLAIILVGFTGLIVLQIFLSRRESKWFGLIVPAIAFLVSLLTPLNMMAPPDGISITFILQMLLSLLIANIPTLIFLAIYFACRERIRRKKQLEKMNIQDLD